MQGLDRRRQDRRDNALARRADTHCRKFSSQVPEIPHLTQISAEAGVRPATNLRFSAGRLLGAVRALHMKHMRLSAGLLRSSTALVLVVLLFSSTTLPLALCASEARQARRAAETPQPPASHDSCHKSPPPGASLSCCCDNAPVPTSTPATTIIVESSFGFVMSVVAARAPATEGLSHVLEASVLRIHSRPLFTLFSAFLL